MWRSLLLLVLQSTSPHPLESACEPQGASSTSLNQEGQEARDQEHHHGLLLLRARQPGKSTRMATPPHPTCLLQAAIIGFVMLETTNASIMRFITHFVITMRILNYSSFEDCNTRNDVSASSEAMSLPF